MPRALTYPVIMATVTLATSLFTVAAPRKNDRLVGVFFQSDVSNAQALQKIIAAGGRVVSPGILPHSFIIERQSSDFSTKIRNQGALLVIRAGEGWGCSSEQPNPL